MFWFSLQRKSLPFRTSIPRNDDLLLSISSEIIRRHALKFNEILRDAQFDTENNFDKKLLLDF